jgi:hypothetical protein
MKNCRREYKKMIRSRLSKKRKQRRKLKSRRELRKKSRK